MMDREEKENACFYSETNLNSYHLGKGKACWDSVNHAPETEI